MKATYIKITDSEMFVNHLKKSAEYLFYPVTFNEGWIEVLNKEELLKHLVTENPPECNFVYSKSESNIIEGIYVAPPGMHYEVQEKEIPCPDGLEGCEVFHLKRLALVSFSEAVEEEKEKELNPIVEGERRAKEIAIVFHTVNYEA